MLRDWLEAPVNEPPSRNELLLKLFLGRQTTPEVSVGHLEQFRVEQTERITTYEGLERWLETEQAGDPNLPYWLLTLSHGRVQAEALKRLSESSLETLRNLSLRRESHE